MYLPLHALLSCSLALRLLPPNGGSSARAVKEEDDATLVARLRRGEQAALTALYERHAPSIARRALRLLARSADAEDVVQDAFVEAVRDIEKLQEPRHFSHWLMRITTHQVHRRFRKRDLLRRLGIVGQDDANLEHLAAPSASPELRVFYGQIDRVLSRLPATQRTVWTLRLVEGCTLPEIAELTQRSLASVKRDLNKAQEAVQQYCSVSLEGSALPDAQSSPQILASPLTIQENKVHP